MPRHSSVCLCRCLLRRWAFSVLALCFATVVPTVQAQDRPLKKVTIAVGSQVLNISYPWLMMPLALGYWRQEGYDVNVIGVSGSAQALQQLASGGIEFAELNATNLIQANTDGNAKVRGVMGNGVIDWGLAVIDGGAITDVKDLKSKKIGIVSLATGGTLLLKGLLRSNGLDPDTDIQLIAVGAGAPALDALKNNRVQALMFWQSALTGFENSGAKLKVFRSPQWRSMPDFTLTAMQKLVESDSKMVEAIVRGAAKGQLFAETNPDCARKVQWKSFPGTKPSGADEATLARWDLALLKAQLDTLKDAFQMNGGKLTGAMDPAAYGRFQEFMFNEKQITKQLPRETFIAASPMLIENANRFDRQEIIAAATACKGW